MSEPPSTQSLAYDGQTRFPLQDLVLYHGEMDRILPRLIDMFNTEKCLYGRVAIFNAIAKKILSCSNLDDVANYLEPLLPKLFSMIECCVEHLKILSKFIQNKSNNTGQSAQFCVKKLEMLSTGIATLFEGSTVVCKAFRHRRSFFCWALRSAAKFIEINSIVGECCNPVTDEVPSELAGIFNTICQLPQIVMDDLYEDCVNVNLIANPKFLLNLSSSIQHACRIVNSKDPSFHALLWQLYTNKVICCDVMRKGFDNSKNCYLHYLCFYILTILERILHEMETKEETTSDVVNEGEFDIRSCCNHLKILTFIYKNFRGFKEECIRDIYSMLLVFYYILFRYTSKYCPDTHYEFQRRIVRDVADLMLCLLTENHFLSLLLQPTMKGLKSEAKIVSWFLKLSAVQLFPYCKERNTLCSNDNEGCFCANSFIIICNIMRDLDTVDVEFLLVHITVVQSEGNELRKITVYEFINHVLCDFASKCCPRHFNDMEKLFLKILLAKTDNVCLLVCDIWYFFCRCGPYELILKYCCFFEKLIRQVQNCTSLWIKFFVRRIIQLLPERLKLQLLDICPILAAEIASEEYLVEYKRHFDHLFIVPCAKSLKCPNFGVFIRKIKKLDNLISSQQSDEAFIRDLRIQKIFCLLDLSIRMIVFCEVKEEILLQILHFVIIWNSAGVIQTGVLFILQTVKNMLLLSSSNQQEFLRCLEKLFHIALDHENYIIQHQALCIFYEFSHSTPYKQVVSKCKESSLYEPLVNNFLKKVKGDVLLYEKDVIETVLSQGKWLKKHKNIQFHTNVESDILYIVDSYSALNQKEMRELHFNLKMMKDAAHKLALVKQLPPWALKSIKDTCQFFHKMEE